MADTLSPVRLEREMAAAMRLIAELPDDERLRTDCIEGQTQALECLDAYAHSVLADEALVRQGEDRIRRLKARAERNRAVVAAILQGLGLRRAERPLYTASLSQRSVVTEVPTNEALPTTFYRTAPDLLLIGRTLRAGNAVPGYALVDKPELTLGLRTA